ncbi:MAG TPA: M28 family peptidase, partial [Rhodospirillaceae bacterium]|nr:M28 family peptidase [Rhodospirillaceae bacterium]
RQLTLRPEPSSLRSAGDQTRRFWDIGRKLASSVFLDGSFALPIFDDQTAFARLGIPSFLVIGFDYDPYFNTTRDSLDKCAAGSLESVGRTLVQYLYAQEKGGHP